MMGSSHQDQSSQELLQGFYSLAAAAAPSDSSFCDQWNTKRTPNSCDDFNSSSAYELAPSGQRAVRLSQGTSVSVPHLIQDLGFHWAINASDGLMPENSSDQKLNVFGHQEELRLPPAPDFPENSSFETCGGAGGEYLNGSFPHLPEISTGSSDMETDAVFPESLKRGFCQLPSFTSARVLPRDDREDESALQGAFYHHHKMPSLVSGASTEEEKGSMISSWELASSRNPRFEQRSSCSPFKVRKEKLRDRIAALQQLVAPFGKTDTSTVLMEAVGYIRFLLDQVEKLSVPYRRPSGNKRSRTTKEEPKEEESNEDKPERDLKSRGLCLVPLSLTSYIAAGHEHVFWSTWSPTI